MYHHDINGNLLYVHESWSMIHTTKEGTRIQQLLTMFKQIVLSLLLLGASTMSSFASSSQIYLASSRTSFHLVGPCKYLGILQYWRHRLFCIEINFSDFLEKSLFLWIEWMKIYMQQSLLVIKELTIKDGKQNGMLLNLWSSIPMHHSQSNVVLGYGLLIVPWL